MLMAYAYSYSQGVQVSALVLFGQEAKRATWPQVPRSQGPTLSVRLIFNRPTQLGLPCMCSSSFVFSGMNLGLNRKKGLCVGEVMVYFWRERRIRPRKWRQSSLLFITIISNANSLVMSSGSLLPGHVYLAKAFVCEVNQVFPQRTGWFPVPQSVERDLLLMALSK